MKKAEPWIVIPAFNTARTITKVVEKLKSQGYKNIIIVDDGSKDSTYNIASSTGVIVLRHIINRGQGAALQTGIIQALKMNPLVIVTFDADGQHDPLDIENLMLPVISGEVDVALGSRFMKRCNVPIIRKIALKCGALIIYIFHGLWLTDSHNGLRCFSASAARMLDITSDRMEHASEIIEIIKKNGWKYKEVPVVIHYNDRTLRDGQNNMAAFRILGKMFWRKIAK